MRFKITEHLTYEDCNKVYDIMEKSFPPNERRTRIEQRQLLDNPRFKILAVKSDRDVKAFMTVWSLEDWTFVEHFAVHPKLRNEGIGKRFITEFLARCETRVCLEAELPTEGEMAKRRIGFYERNGFTLNHYPYKQPSITAGQKPVDLMIMTTGGGISEPEFLRLKEQLYKYVYKVKGYR